MDRFPETGAVHEQAMPRPAVCLIPDPFAVLDEMVRVLRPGGRLAIMASLASDRALHTAGPGAGAGTVRGCGWSTATTSPARLRRACFTEVEQEVRGFAQYAAATASA
jgi:ubiquinone/menaquinone biosynthesis C-methylase UbiE